MALMKIHRHLYGDLATVQRLTNELLQVVDTHKSGIGSQSIKSRQSRYELADLEVVSDYLRVNVDNLASIVALLSPETV